MRRCNFWRGNLRGFTLVEVVLAIALLGMLGLIVISAFIYGRQSTAVSVDRNRAAELANEGVEAVRNIATASYSNLAAYTNGTPYYLTVVGNQWNLVTTPQPIENLFNRTLVFSDGPSGSRQLKVTVSWQATLQRSVSLSVTTLLANWKAATAAPSKAGIFVYADGGTTGDRMSYRLLQTTGIWTDVAAMPDVDTTTTNRVPRSVKLYSAQTGSVKMVLSRHFDGTKQYLYGTVWNGSSWNTPKLLAQWSSTDWLDVGNFSGSFLANGTFVAVYDDATNVPKFNTWNGSSWSAQGSLPVIGKSDDFPTAIVVKARPGTNEAMAAFLGVDFDTSTSYFANGTWSDYTNHANNADNNRHLVDFDWSPVNPTQGVLVFTSSTNDRSLKMRVFTADGQGSGSWAPVSNAPQQPTTLGSVSVVGRSTGAAEFIICDKDTASPPHVYCYQAVPQSNGITTPANNLITPNTASGEQISFSTGYESNNGVTGLNAYSDNTASTKLKLYDSNANSWGTSALAFPSANATVVKTKLLAKPNSNDAMVIVADANANLYSVMYNASQNNLYSTPTGYGWTVHNAHGPSTASVWFDFAWDN